MIVPFTRNLLALCVTVVAAIAALWFTSDKVWTPPESRPIDSSLFDVPAIDYKHVAGEALAEISARPIFSATRRPPPPEPVAEAENEPDPFANVKVLGLFGSGGEGGVILQIDGRSKRVRHGEKLGSWVLRGVNGMSAQFTGPGGTQKNVEMRYLAQPASAPPPSDGVPQGRPQVGSGDGAAGTAANPGQKTDSPGQAAVPVDQAVPTPARAAEARAEARAAARARRQPSRISNQ
jgi:hypothetical protein